MAKINFDFSGSTVLVTGGSRGIGKAIVAALAEAGANVAFTYRSNEEAAQKVCAELEAHPGKLLAVQTDAADPDLAPKVYAEVEEKLGPVDGLVNNAGITDDMAMFRMGADNWRRVIQTNLDGTFFLSQAAVKAMIHNKAGKIVNMTSVSGMVASPGQTNYSASKAGIIGMTRSLAAEVARFNIQVNAIAPGFIATEMMDAMPEKAIKGAKKKIPAKRFGETREVAELVMYLLSPASDFITGQTVVIDGGMTA